MTKARFLIVLSLSTGVILSPRVGQGLVRFDFEQPFFTEPGRVVKDHCLIRLGSTYHLFYLRGDPAVSIGHATSPDLVHWTLQPQVLTTHPGSWDENALWAPYIVPQGGSLMLMFFTGVNYYWAQQTGVAVGTDPYNWLQDPEPVYHPDTSWARWDENSWSNGRDPFVFYQDGMYYLLVTATTSSNLGAIASAVSTDLVNWQDNGPLYVHNSWHVLESVQLIERNNKYHLFFTEETVGGISHMMADSLYGQWDISQRNIIDMGSAPEVNVFDGNYIISRHSVYNDYNGNYTYVICFDTLAWSGDYPYINSPWPLAKDWEIVWGTAFLFQPTFGNNPYVRGDTVQVNFEGLCWLGSYERYQGPLRSGGPGNYVGDGAMGMIRSKPFVITGRSMNLLVGGGNYPDQCYVALVDASTGQVLCSETGKNTDHMDRRYWDLTPYQGSQVYIEIADLSSASFGHINVDDIRESNEMVGNQGGGDPPVSRKRPLRLNPPKDGAVPMLSQNSPNPFRTTTAIPYFLPEGGQIRIEIYDVEGRSVRGFAGHGLPGWNYTVWDGRDQAGSEVPAGIYFYRLQLKGNTVGTRKMVVIR